MALTVDQVEDLLRYIGVQKVSFRSTSKGAELTGCCPIHGESNPSFGVNIEMGVFNCFSCGASGDIPWLLFKSMPDDFKNIYEAQEFIRDRYNVTFNQYERDFDEKSLRYEDLQSIEYDRYVLPRIALAPFRSGKQTYNYIYKRGLTRDTIRRFLIGRDIENKTVTIPVFWEDGQLAGIIGRYVGKRAKNERYKIYNFPKAELIFPLDKLETPSSGVGIMVEGILDAVYMHQCGYPNCFSLMGDTMSYAQRDLVQSRFRIVVDMLDADTRGRAAAESIRLRRLRGVPMKTVQYPEGCKDPFDCTPEQIAHMLKHLKPCLPAMPRIS